MMRMMKIMAPVLLLAIGMVSGATRAGETTQRPDERAYREYLQYRAVVLNTERMVQDRQAIDLVRRHKLNIVNVTWEDTGRYKGSSVGPNISDMTIQVQMQNPKTGKYELHCMPVIRFPNFSDMTGDLKMEKFFLLTGNEKGKDLKQADLRMILKNLRDYLSNPGSWKGWGKSLLAGRDSHVLVSAQACFLPIPKNGMAVFNPVLFNYQSTRGNPAVLTILATREGTSITVIDNARDGFSAGRSWGQRLFFNQKGERTSLTGQRLSDYQSSQNKNEKEAGHTVTVRGDQENTEGLNLVLLIQVPLKLKPRQRNGGPKGASDKTVSTPSMKSERRSDVENAVVGHGKVEGPFTEIDNLKIERDERFPVRVTVQFYKATSNGVVSDNDIAQIAGQINRVYRQADYVGSLVTDGKTVRSTEWDGVTGEPPGWWNDFWERYEKEHNEPRDKAIERYRKLLGPRWKPESADELIRNADKMK